MKKANNNSVQHYALALKSISLASGMLIFDAVCDSTKKEWSECKKVEDAYSKFDGSIEKACNDKLGLTAAVVNYGKAFIDELNDFQKLSEAQKKNLQELIKRIKSTSKRIINPED